MTLQTNSKMTSWALYNPAHRFVLREFWVRSPDGDWQYFRILDDGIMEIRNTGNFERSAADFGRSPMPPDPDRGFTLDPGKDQVSPYRTGFICPFF
jgi:hypothetical protein